jgi:hypothetical protein
MPMRWDDVVAFALSLPDCELSTSYGTPVVKTNGRMLLGPSREAGSFCLATGRDSIELLKAAYPDTYWQSPHYVGWPAVLVRLDTRRPAHVRATIRQAHAWCATQPKPRSRRRKR